MRIVTVFNSRSLNGARQEYEPGHVLALRDQCAKYAPQATFECLTDVSERLIPGVKRWPYKYDWPGWWAKLALMDPTLPGDFLFLDLDTVIVGPLDDILAVKKLTLLRDFYRNGVKLKEGLGGGLMYLPDKDRAPVWDFWRQQPQLQMRVYARGDQFLFERLWLQTAQRWQDVVPGQVCSWKVHCQNGVPPEARLIAFHGQPRPFAIGQFLHLYR